MPNWCSNVAIFEHENEAILQQLVDAYNSGETMQTMWPCPHELRETVAGSMGRGTPEQAALEVKERENVARYGAKNWYDWCVDNWGTKWDFGRDVEYNGREAKIQKRKNGKKYVKLGFDTAWSPPSGFYAHMHDVLGFKVEAYFFEPGCAFIGSSSDGLEDVITLRSLKEDWLKAHVPAKLCKMFNLYEMAAEACEEDNI